MPCFSRIWLSLEVSLPAAALEARLPLAPAQLAVRLADAVNAYIHEAGLGYYPALAHVQQQGKIEAELWLLVEQTAWWLDSQARYTLRRALAVLFSSLEVEQLQPRAYALPKARPWQRDAQAQLLRHLTLDTVHGVLRLTHVSKQPPDPQVLERFIAQRVRQNLVQAFANVNILSVTVEPQT